MLRRPPRQRSPGEGSGVEQRRPPARGVPAHPAHSSQDNDHAKIAVTGPSIITRARGHT
jgi:hypothetical protein